MREISEEIRAVQADPLQVAFSPGSIALATRLPGFLRLAFFRGLEAQSGLDQAHPGEC